MTYPPQGNPPVEGEYSAYSLAWNKNLQGDLGYMSTFGPQRIQVNENTNRILMYYEGSGKRGLANLTTGALIGTIDTVSGSGGAEFGTPGSLSRYYAEVINTGATYNLVIYKDTAAIQTIDLCATLGIAYVDSKFFTFAFSKDGKYIAIAGPSWYVLSNLVQLALFKGA